MDNENGILFKPGDASALYGAVKEVWSRSSWLFSLSQAARQEFDRKYTADANYKILMNIYQMAIENRGKALQKA
jgi:glycosyltransferase involved in cell wall biosynthesis